MKRIILLLMILISTLLSAENEMGREKVEFKDKEFEEIIRNILKKGFGDIYIEDMSKIEEINCYPYLLIDIKGIELCTNLKKLNLAGTQIKDISLLSNLTNIEYINLRRNKINNFNYINKLIKLKYLALDYTGISDLSDISNLKNLKYLSLNGNNLFNEKINNIEVINLNKKIISNFKELEYLYLSHNDIKDISFLENIKNLKALDISDNKIQSIESIGYLINSGEVNLKVLDLAHNKIESIESLRYFINLEEVDLRFNEFCDIRVLGNLKNLNTIILDDFTVGNKKIVCRDAKHLVNLEKLKILIGGRLKNIDKLYNLKNLERLDLSYNNLKDINFLNGLKNLKILNLSKNEIENMDGIKNCEKLVSLGLASSKIEKIEILENLKNLEEIDLSDNKLIGIEELKVFLKLEKLKQLNLDEYKEEIYGQTNRFENSAVFKILKKRAVFTDYIAGLSDSISLNKINIMEED